jgi:hypothetical protein
MSDKTTTLHSANILSNEAKSTSLRTMNFTRSSPQPKVNTTTDSTLPSHIEGWDQECHYCNIGGQCGQSCPCCRARVYLSKIDPDAWFGACNICLNTNKNNLEIKIFIK